MSKTKRVLLRHIQERNKKLDAHKQYLEASFAHFEGLSELDISFNLRPTIQRIHDLLILGLHFDIDQMLFSKDDSISVEKWITSKKNCQLG